MADKKITELTGATSASTADVVPIVQGSVTKKITLQTLFANIPGNVSYSGVVIESGTPDTVTTGALSLTTSMSYLSNNTAGVTSTTLADGTQGQEKTIVCTLHTSDVDLTPTNLAGATTKLTFTAVGQTAKLKFMNGSWHIISTYGATIV